MDMISWIGRMLTIISVTAAADVKRTTFKLTSSPYHSSTPIDNPRESNSSIECIRMCISEYTNCLSATYNIKTGACTPDQPNNAYDKEDCVEIGSRNDIMYLNDNKCWLLSNVICEETAIK